MLYSYFGQDRQKVSEKAKALVDSLLAKKPNAERFEVDGDFFNTENFQEIVFGQGLFGKSYIVVLSNINEGESLEIFLKYLEDIKNSPNIFILKAGDLDSETKTKIESFSEKSVVVLSKAIKTEKRYSFNIFSVSDKLGERDRKGLWLYMWKAIKNGHDVEEVFWKLVWQVKTIAIVSESKTANEIGVNPFVFSKSKRYADNYSKEELVELSGNLNRLYHDVRIGKKDFTLGLESLILSV